MQFLRFVKFDSIIDNINKIKKEFEEYHNLFNQKYNFLVFPDLNSFKKIIENVDILNKSLDNENVKNLDIKNNYYNSLYDLINDFITQIKRTSFEHEIFTKIKCATDELDYFTDKINKIMNRIEDPNELENIIEEDIEKFEKKII